MKAPQSDRGISRLDQPTAGTHGWQVRLQRRGVRHGRFFSDSRWGGADAALDVARRYRDRLFAAARRLDESAGRAVRHRGASSARNRSGVVGVSRVTQRSAAGMEYHFWQASWTAVTGERCTVRFSVKKHGDEKAFVLACEARRDAIG